MLMDTRPEGLGVNGAGIKFRSLSLGGVRQGQDDLKREPGLI